ncbi:DUF3141 domain-containing protein [Legionella pneumophila serogroup 1]|uniref:Alpha/beta hydrolase family protein n=1 Tax=Legionella moravica TaxID=39962 RepID=A0A378JVP5_9GAMM|nr:DUF3141 domain-containing protein [Legionella moravica]HAT7052157.1 DUF3141 domain-containing protein [Legionella pneumophila]KTD35522.1 Alpha/beta hydrolase family protein [Legionella moravica]STX62110.1 poly(R)-hydroxyalkanoic acid synthase, class III, PhaC subunit [Legionella moravica]HAT7054409.1 DUF3141 domain-containing protein [Legionella pneumophila]HAT7064302.1 DUF3141 domain-containing protein [Legionella pneumophila]
MDKQDIDLPYQIGHDFFSYQLDCWQRSILFFDTLRERANNMMEHEQQGLPPLLNFKYELVLDGRTLEPKANYALVKILEVGDICFNKCFDPTTSPVIVVDPRAGHGPGIGGFKRDSEVGIALHSGHAVYFVIFYPDPIPHQTLADVLATMRHFVEKVQAWHAGKSPILYGNCQAGWMLALLASDCVGSVGLTVMNGSPVSYWSNSEEEANPMQLLGGLLGGVWSARFLSDLKEGTFDGAWLVSNFELLNPTTAIWDKYYGLFDEIDVKSERFLEFERWWNGFYQFSEEEITATVNTLFIGNQLERGEMLIHQGCTYDLKRIQNPIVVFASQGDQITPPRQALHWIRTIYPTTQALKKAKQRIVYLLHPSIGHLGIFVSANVVRLHHRAILEHTAAIEKLKPGLYEMVIINPTGDPDCSKEQYQVRFEERELTELCTSSSTEPFEKVRQTSEANDSIYQKTTQPLVRSLSNPFLSWWLEKTHPMRLSRYVFSEKVNPLMKAIELLGPPIQANRRMATENNSFKKIEHDFAQMMRYSLEFVRIMRNDVMTNWFDALYKDPD